jgi:hypothetical protein
VAEPAVRRNQGSRSGRRLTPPPLPSDHLPAVSKHPNRALGNPTPSPAVSLAKTAGELAGIRPVALPPLAQGLHCRAPKHPGCFVQT